MPRITHFIFLLFLALAPAAVANAVEPPDDCAGCHDLEQRTLSSSGGSHGRELGCLDCHPAHPPTVEQTALACADCHEGSPHYELDDCLNCHVDPHQPLKIEFTGSISNGSCASCHAFIQQTLSDSGGSHGSELGCLDCHQTHPPTGEATSIACADCHEGSPHYALNDCLHCHADPHRPLAALRDPVKPARAECLTCHDRIGVLMDEAPSQHSELSCTHCHSRHKEILLCLDCHSPHQQGQNEEDCSKCHPAHQPLKIVPTGYVSAGLCRPCHQKQANDLASTNTDHGGVNCIYCHRGPHPTVHSCQDCHGMPHAQQIHSRFRDCLECHGDAHNLISGR